MADKKMKATIVLDCCHSGSATRGSGRVRFHGLPQTCQSTEADESLLTFMNKLLKHDIEKEHEELHEGSRVSLAIEVFQQKSEAELDKPVKNDMIEPGCIAVLLSVPQDRQSAICFLEEVSGTVEEQFRDAWAAVPPYRTARMRIIARHARLPADFIINVKNIGDFEILDRDGVSLPNLESQLSPHPTNIPASSKKLIYRLERLDLFNMFKALKNLNEILAMCRALGVTVWGKSLHRHGGLAPAKQGKGAYNVNHREYLKVQVKNIWRQRLHLVVFNLQPLYGITHVFPRQSGDSEPLDQDQMLVFPLRMKISRNFEGTACVDIFKFIATPQPKPLAALELDDLCDAENNRKGSGANDPLNDLLDSLVLGL